MLLLNPAADPVFGLSPGSAHSLRLMELWRRPGIEPEFPVWRKCWSAAHVLLAHGPVCRGLRRVIEAVNELNGYGFRDRLEL
jgi:hypothetical protein